METEISLMKDGNAWGALIGPNIVEGICGFGDTESEALEELALNMRRAGR